MNVRNDIYEKVKFMLKETPEDRIMDLMSLRFIDEKNNILT